MNCSHCESERIANFSGKHDDRCGFTYKKVIIEGEIPALFVGFRGDYFGLNICLECGTIQDWEPVSDDEIREYEE